jgi:hypothetical protein
LGVKDPVKEVKESCTGSALLPPLLLGVGPALDQERGRRVFLIDLLAPPPVAIAPLPVLILGVSRLV